MSLGEWPQANGEPGAGGKLIFAVAEKHGKGAVFEVGNDQVRVMIVIEVGNGD